MSTNAPVWTVVVADDEPPARQVLTSLLAAHADFAVVAECGDGASALAACEAQPVDLLFLDVQMPGLDGFGVVGALGPNRWPEIVFVTAFDRHALRAFEAQALDYLLKPFSDERFAHVLAHVTRRLAARDAGDLRARLAALTRAHEARVRQLVLRDGGRTVIIPWDDIDWIEAEDYCVRFHTTRDRPLVRGSLQQMAARLDPAEFVRIHRSAIVNVTRVREVRPLPSGDHEVLLSTGITLRMSRTFRRHWDAVVFGDVRPG
jgi:two-component system, LytTR family, response regulator